MNKEIWLKSNFTKNDIPDWNCPHCKKGILKIGKLNSEETEFSKKLHTHIDWEPEWKKYIFSGNLICSNCGEQVAFLGNGQENLGEFYVEQINDYVLHEYSEFTPKYFYPTLCLFELNKECPKDIINIINESFALFWNDLPSCANKIRISLELLMDEYRIKKTFINKKGERQNLSLHQRILEFKSRNEDVANYLLAIKWIGNIGSHKGKLGINDILEAYEMLELSLNKLYDNTEKRLKKIAKEINKSKGKKKRI